MIQSTDNQLGQFLVEMGKLDPDMLDAAVRDSHKTGDRLESVLVKMGLCEEDDVLQAVAKTLHLPYRKLTDGSRDASATTGTLDRRRSRNAVSLDYVHFRGG